LKSWCAAMKIVRFNCVSASAVGTKNGLAPFSSIRAAAACALAGLVRAGPPGSGTIPGGLRLRLVGTLANNMVSPLGHVKYEAAMPTKAKYIGLWLWDSALHAVALRHIDPKLARDQIRVFLAHQLPDGMLPDVVFDEGVVTEIDHPVHARVTKPPILAWAALKIHQTAPDLDFLREIYLPLTRWNAWWFDQSEEGIHGLAQYNHPYSSGLDDNPLWDEGMPVVSPDLNTYLCLQMKALAQIAAALGLETEAVQWKARSENPSSG
jgi:putative isomerase